MFCQLPDDIIKEIYEFDNTYHEIFKKCLEQLKTLEKKYRVRFVKNSFNKLQFSKRKVWNFTTNIEWTERKHYIYGTFVYYNIYIGNIWEINPIITTYINFYCPCEFCNEKYINYLKLKLIQ